MSDIHVEPWYAPNDDDTSTSAISRFDDPNVDNMFECRDVNNQLLDKSTCTLTGRTDPPMAFFSSALNAWNMYSRRPEESVIFFIGDAQAHSYLEEPAAIESLMASVVSKLLYYFEPDGIYIAPGNNDGPHNAAFTNHDELGLTAAW